MPAQDPYAGSPAATAARSGSSRSNTASNLPIVVDSPPGSKMPSTLASSPGRRPRGSPGSPAARGVPLIGRQRLEVDADHGLAQSAGHLGDDIRVVVEGLSLIHIS